MYDSLQQLPTIIFCLCSPTRLSERRKKACRRRPRTRAERMSHEWLRLLQLLYHHEFITYACKPINRRKQSFYRKNDVCNTDIEQINVTGPVSKCAFNLHTIITTISSDIPHVHILPFWIGVGNEVCMVFAPVQHLHIWPLVPQHLSICLTLLLQPCYHIQMRIYLDILHAVQPKPPDMSEISVTTALLILGQAPKPMIYSSSEESKSITAVLFNLPLGYARWV